MLSTSVPCATRCFYSSIAHEGRPLDRALSSCTSRQCLAPPDVFFVPFMPSSYASCFEVKHARFLYPTRWGDIECPSDVGNHEVSRYLCTVTSLA